MCLAIKNQTLILAKFLTVLVELILLDDDVLVKSNIVRHYTHDIILLIICHSFFLDCEHYK